MNESTPFVKKSRKYSNDDDEEQQHEQLISSDEFEYGEYHAIQLSPTTKYILYIITGFTSLFILYVFTVLLPEYFIPEATTLSKIQNISELNVSLLPNLGQVQDDDEKRTVSRIILIGDVHGHYIEFRKLLSKLKYNHKDDHILFLGDFITKGPDSFKVLNYAIDNKIDCILGNHEYYVLQYYASYHGLTQPEFMYNSPEQQQQQSSSSSPTSPFLAQDSFNDDPEFLLAKKLEPHHVQYINNCSIIKKLGNVPNGKGIAVHAGIVPQISLKNQNPLDNLEMRSLISPYFNETTSDPHTPGSKRWSKVYNSKKSTFYPPDNVVYYGHDASKGLNLKKFSKGLDSGCDTGGQLSAMVISRKGNELYEEIIQVNC